MLKKFATADNAFFFLIYRCQRPYGRAVRPSVSQTEIPTQYTQHSAYSIQHASSTSRTRRRVPCAVTTCSHLAAGMRCAHSMDLPSWCNQVCMQSCLICMTIREHVLCISPIYKCKLSHAECRSATKCTVSAVSYNCSRFAGKQHAMSCTD